VRRARPGPRETARCAGPIWRTATAFGEDATRPAAKRFIGIFSANVVSICNTMGMDDVTSFGIPGVCTGALDLG
jgi:hypothetical protein